MCPLTAVIAIGLLFSGSLQGQALENQAISRVQQTPVSQLDSGLPDRPFAIWLKQTAGPRAGITWQLTDCGEQTGTPSDRERDIPTCVEATAVLLDDRKVVIEIIVGTFRKGIAGQPKIYFAVVEDKGELYDVKRLRDLPEMLKTRLVKIRRKAIALPVINGAGMDGDPLLLLAPSPITGRDVIAKAPELLGTEQAPLPPAEPRRTSESVLRSNVITRVMPTYPLLAKQINAFGEVKVQITIAEDGRVIEAIAVSGPATLRPAAEEAARKWVFRQTILNGAPVRTQGDLTFVFTRPQ